MSSFVISFVPWLSLPGRYFQDKGTRPVHPLRSQPVAYILAPPLSYQASFAGDWFTLFWCNSPAEYTLPVSSLLLPAAFTQTSGWLGIQRRLPGTSSYRLSHVIFRALPSYPLQSVQICNSSSLLHISSLSLPYLLASPSFPTAL